MQTLERELCFDDTGSFDASPEYILLSWYVSRLKLAGNKLRLLLDWLTYKAM